MAYDSNLLKLAEVTAFRSMLERRGVECRDGKGEFQVLQVRTSPQCWAVVNRNAQDIVTTHPDLAPYIKAFRVNNEFINKMPDRKPIKPAPAQRDTFLEDLRDDFAMHALQGLLSNPHFLQPHPDTGRSLGPKTPDLALRDAYRFADAAMEARKVRP